MKKNKEVVPVILFTGAGASCAEGINLPNMTGFFKQIMDKNHNPTDSFIRNKSYFKYVMDCMYPNKDENQVYDLEKVLGTLYKLASTFSDEDAFSIMNEQTLVKRIADNVNSLIKEQKKSINAGYSSIEMLNNTIKSTMTQRYTEIKQSAKELLHDLQLIVRKTYSDVNLKGIYVVYGILFKDLFSVSLNYSLKEEGQVILPVFTTNYDPSIDYVLRPSPVRECVELHESWRGTVKNYSFADGMVQHEYGSYFVWRQRAFQNKCEDGLVVHYHKLHGSALWEKRYGEVLHTTDPISDLSDMPRDFNMIYPSDKTTPDEDPYSFSHIEFDRYIRKAKILVVIGFAFRDPGLVNIMKRGLRENSQLNIVIVGPTPNQWENEFKDFLKLPKVIQIEGYFGEETVHAELITFLENNLATKKEVVNS